MPVTEADWLRGESADELSTHIVNGSPRKLRLLAVACARRIPPELLDDDCRKVLDASEASADGKITPGQRRRIELPLRKRVDDIANEIRELREREDYSNPRYRRYKAVAACWMTSQADRWMVRGAGGEAADTLPDSKAEDREQCRLLHDIYGNPFRPVAFDPRWRTADAVALAEAIYEAKAFERLPILADALMDAGCEEEAVISHCRGEGPHVRGCWVVDLVLGKE